MANKKKVKKESLKEKSEERDEKKAKKKHETQLKWVIIGMISVLLLFLLLYVIVQESKKIYYGGLEFKKLKYGQLILYHSKIPIKDASGNLVANYNLYLRNNPLDLKGIKINGSLRFRKEVVISVDSSIEGCSDNGIAGGGLGMFFSAAGITADFAYANETYANEKKASYIENCPENKGYSAIFIRKGDKNEVRQESQDCYVLEFKECDILKVTEKFIIGVYAQSKGIEI